MIVSQAFFEVRPSAFREVRKCFVGLDRVNGGRDGLACLIPGFQIPANFRDIEKTLESDLPPRFQFLWALGSMNELGESRTRHVIKRRTESLGDSAQTIGRHTEIGCVGPSVRCNMFRDRNEIGASRFAVRDAVFVGRLACGAWTRCSRFGDRSVSRVGLRGEPSTAFARETALGLRRVCEAWSASKLRARRVIGLRDVGGRGASLDAVIAKIDSEGVVGCPSRGAGVVVLCLN